MDSYTNIPIWETKKRIRRLKEFLGMIITYFGNIERSFMVDNAIENDIAKTNRSKINIKIDQVRKIIIQSNVSYIVRYIPAPAVGGAISNIDIFHNLHQLNRFQIPDSQVTDTIERAIGVYESDLTAAWLRTINPFYWLNRLLNIVASVPFRILASAGFNQKAAEESVVGKIFKSVVYILGVLASVLTVIQLLGYLEKFNLFWHSILGI